MLFRNFKKGIRGICSLLLTLMIVVCCSLTSMAADSSLVTDAVPSYEGLPAFPTSFQSGDTVYDVDAYFLFLKNDVYELYCISLSNVANSDSAFYLCGDYLCVVPSYRSNSFVLSDEAWVGNSFYSSSGNSNLFEISYMVYNSVNVYTDSTFSTVHFPQATLSPSMVGLTAAEMTQLTMREMVGLIPLVVGSMTCLIGLRKGLAALWTRLQKA